MEGLSPAPDRRGLLLAAASLVATVRAAGASAEVKPETGWLAPPKPVQTPVKLARLPDVGLAYWDTGGPGEPVVLMHPATGSILNWGYQEPALRAAGYRAIAYSRRGHHGSEPGPADRMGSMSGDLLALADLLGLGKFHLLGSGLGAFGAAEFAAAHPERLRSVVVACAMVVVEDDPEMQAMRARLESDQWHKMPEHMGELSPAYRAANPAGASRWNELYEMAVDKRVRPPLIPLTMARMAAWKVPTLVIGGDTDPFGAPPLLRRFAGHIAGARLEIIREAGHSAHWEQPAAFNRAVLGFLNGVRG